MSLNRIYQGRIVGLKVLPDKALDAEPSPPERMEEILDAHHGEFQRAVNYHLFHLLRLSTDRTSTLGKIRSRMVEADVAARRLRAGDAADERERRSLQDLASHDVWNTFRRNGRQRRGMSASLFSCLGIPMDLPLAEAFERADASLNDPTLDRGVYDAAVQALVADLGGGGAIQQKGREYLPRFCDPGFSGSYPRSRTALEKDRVQSDLPQRLYSADSPPEPETLRAELEFEHFANINPDGNPLDRQRCIELLQEGIRLLVAENGLSESDADRLHSKLPELPEDFSLPAYQGASVKQALRNRFFAFLVLKHVEASSATVALLRATYPEPKAPTNTSTAKPAKKRADATDLMRFGDDPVKLARGSKSMVYPGFTSLSGWATGSDGRMAWKEFDIAAFKEALKVLNQVEVKGKERAELFAEAQVWIAYLEKGGKAPRSKTGEDDDEDASIPTFAGDERFARFQTLLSDLKTQEGDDAEDYAAEDPRGLRGRAIRGRKDLFAAWNKELKKAGAREFDALGHETTLLSILNEHQAEHRDTMGWARLYRAFTKAENWDFWRDPSPEEALRRRETNHASDFLGAYVTWSELQTDAERYAEPIRFSPADDSDSRRLFLFSDACKFTPKGEYRHLPGETVVIVPVAVAEGGFFARRRIRLDYSAPRLLRDGLRTGEAGERLTEAVWNQPMMAALGVEAEDVAQDISEAAVALMPDWDRNGEKRFLLNFPITLDQSSINARVAELRGQSLDWAKQSVSFGTGDQVQHFYLRWPGFDKVPTGLTPWHVETNTFRVLSVDLGVRFAAACARLRAYAAASPEQERDRRIGTHEGQPWFAQVERLITLRLPGEGRRDGGHRDDHADGRWARSEEITAARELILALDLHPAHLGIEGAGYRIGEIGAKLLVALRRAIAHLRSLHRWTRMGEANRWEEAAAEIGEDRQRALRHAEVEGDARPVAEWSRILDGLESGADCAARADELTAKLRKAVEEVASVLVPLRHGRWSWTQTEEPVGTRPACFQLKRVDGEKGEPGKRIRDQGGLSIARIDRITDFRKILLSFNRLCGLKPGQTPPTGREMRAQPLPDPCPTLSDKLDAMKEQRVDQTAHAILAEALGLELKPHEIDDAERRRRDIHGEYASKRAPVDFIVVEDLMRYRTTQGRTREENSRLMQWCHRQITAKLKMLCESYGIVVLETPAAYSSRFCSRSGQPGFRAEELTKGAFEQSFQWRQALARAEQDSSSANAAAILRVRDAFAALPQGAKRTLLLPRPGGGVFVPLGADSVQNADLNAAVNLGLRAIAAPNQFDIHSRVRSEWKTGRYITRETRNRFGSKPLEIVIENLAKADEESAPSALEARPNFFFCPVRHEADLPKFDSAKLIPPIPGSPPLFSARALWKTVNQHAWDRCLEINGIRP
jgi:hypothetical protein